MKDLKEKTIRGGLARICAQAANFGLRLVALMVLARLLGPKEFGLVGMVTAFTGVLDLFRDFGLSTASVQRETVTEEQVSTLFWINVLVGAILAGLVLALAPVIAGFYHEPRLLWIARVMAAGFIFNATGVQHSARLQREMRFTALAVISTVSLVIGTTVAIVMAKVGYGYWSLVAMTLLSPLVSTIGLWLTSKWVPGPPRRQVGIRSMMWFGGTVTLNGLVCYAAYNLDKVLLGRFWGAGILGLYGRAYQLVSIPTNNLNSAVGEVAFSALSRVQGDTDRFKNYFLKGYSLVTAMTLPITLACALFAKDLTFVLLGPKWGDTAGIFRLLTPTIMIFAMINPIGWLQLSLGMVLRSLKLDVILACIVITGYVVGLPYGAKGVAFGFSAALILWFVPHVALCLKGTMISLQDLVLSVRRPLLSGIAATVIAFGAQFVLGSLLSPFWRLALGGTVLLGTYMGMLLYVMGQKHFYLQLLRGLRKSTPIAETALASA